MDEIWKEIIEELFHDFCFFFMPDPAKNIDFPMGYEFLDKEIISGYGRQFTWDKVAKQTVDVFKSVLAGDS